MQNSSDLDSVVPPAERARLIAAAFAPAKGASLRGWFWHQLYHVRRVAGWVRRHALLARRGVAASVPALFVRRRNYIRARHPGDVVLETRRVAAVFCHYDPAGRINAKALAYLRALHEAGAATVLVSVAPALAAEDIAAVKPFIALLLHRENIGHDFGCYQDGVAALGDLARFDKLIIANDSVYGPFAPLAETLARCDESADVWSATDSYEIHWHLQSYFYCINRSALAHPAFADYWRTYIPAPGRDWAIRAGELGFTRRMQRAGLRTKAAYPMQAAWARFAAEAREASLAASVPKRGVKTTRERIYFLALRNPALLNPTHFFWPELMAMGWPFIKRDMAERNPMNLANTEAWKAAVLARFGPEALTRAAIKP